MEGALRNGSKMQGAVRKSRYGRISEEEQVWKEQ
jgi:hypothetical protein